MGKRDSVFGLLLIGDGTLHDDINPTTLIEILVSHKQKIYKLLETLEILYVVPLTGTKQQVITPIAIPEPLGTYLHPDDLRQSHHKEILRALQDHFEAGVVKWGRTFYIVILSPNDSPLVSSTEEALKGQIPKSP